MASLCPSVPPSASASVGQLNLTGMTSQVQIVSRLGRERRGRGRGVRSGVWSYGACRRTSRVGSQTRLGARTDRHTQTVAAAGRRPSVGRSAGRPEVTKGFEAVGRSVRGWCSSGHGLGGGGGGGAGVCLSIDGGDVIVILRAEVGEGGQSSHVFSGEGQATGGGAADHCLSGEGRQPRFYDPSRRRAAAGRTLHSVQSVQSVAKLS